MDDVWKAAASLNRSSAQPGHFPASLNQFDMSPGQNSQPYVAQVAQEVCVIERTIRQEAAGTTTLNQSSFGGQGPSTNRLRSELLALVSGAAQQQQQLRDHASSISSSSRSPYMGSNPQLCHMNSLNLTGYGGWPAAVNHNAPSSSRMNSRMGKSSTVAADAAPHYGKEHDGSILSSGQFVAAVQKNNMDSNVARTSGGPLGLVKPNLNFTCGGGPHEQGGDASRQTPSPQWLAEVVSQQQQRPRCQSAQAPSFLSANSDLQRTVPSVPDMAAPPRANHLPSTSGSASVGGWPRVFCSNSSGVYLNGELCLTDAGRLGVICSCHNVHMSVSKFTQHAGIHSVVNPGEAVFMESGENLVQWRKLFFCQYGVKVPDDNVGWDWSDLDPLEAGQAKYNSVVTQSWQKEVDVSSGGKLSVLKSRMTQVWDASLASGNSSMLHATSQEVSNMNYPSNAGPHHVSSLEARETLLKSFGRAGYPVANMGVQFGSGQMFSDPAAAQQQQGKSRNQGVNPGNNQLFHNSSVSGGMPMNEYINFINDRHQRCIVPPAHQLLGGGKTTNGPHYPPNRWDDGQEPPRLKEKESSLSSFELRLGQPSQQQTQPAGDSFVASLASLPASAVERHKALLFDQVVQRVLDARMQQDIQNSTSRRFSDIAGHVGEHQHLTNRNLPPGYEGPRGGGRLDSSPLNGLNGEVDRGGMNVPLMQSVRQLVNTYPTQHLESNAEHVQMKFPPPALDCSSPQLNKLATGMDSVANKEKGIDVSAWNYLPHADRLRRSVTLENGTTLDKLSSGALMQLSNKTGKRLLENAIQLSFGYRPMGSGSPASVPSDQGSTHGKVGGENFPSNARPSSFPTRGGPHPVNNCSGRNDSQLDPTSSGLGLLGKSVATGHYQQQTTLSNAASMGDQQHGPPPLVSHNMSLQKSPLEESNVNHDGRKFAEPSSEALQECAGSMGGKRWEVPQQQQQQQQQQQVAMDKQGWSVEGVPQLEGATNPGWAPKLKSSQVHGNELCEGFAKASGSGHDELCSQPPKVVEAALANSWGGEGRDTLAQGKPELGTGLKEDIECTCLKCRKASPCSRGRAVPRLAGQVCLKEKGLSAMKLETVRQTLIDGSQEQQLNSSSAPNAEIAFAKVGKTTKQSLREHNGHHPFSATGEEQKEQQLDESTGGAGKSQVPQNEDLLSDTAAKGTSDVAGSLRVLNAPSDVCSKSSENVLSGLSDEGNEKAAEDCNNMLVGQSLSKSLGPNGVLDEGSGIGKCSSSDGVDMGVATADPISMPGDLSKHESPSSLGCPSTNVVTRPLMKRGIQRSRGAWHETEEVEEEEEEETEPAAVVNTREKKRRRTMKWKRLDSDVGAGESKKAKTMALSEYNVEAEEEQVEKPEVGNKNVESDVRPDQSGEIQGGGIALKIPTEKEALKWRRVPLGSDNHSSASVAQGKERTVETITNGEGKGTTQVPQRKNETVLLRVPQGVNRQKAKRALRTNLGPSKHSGIDGGSGILAPVEKLAQVSLLDNSDTTKVSFLKKRDSGSNTPAVTTKAQTIHVLSHHMTENFRSVRIPNRCPSPRNGRMVSLSDILKQPAEPIPSSKSRTTVREALKGAADVRAHKKGDSPQVDMATKPVTHVDQEKVPQLPLKDPKKVIKGLRVLHKEEARKVRSLLELSGKSNQLPAQGAEVFDFVEEGIHVLEAHKHDTPSPPTTFQESVDTIPRSGRSIRTNPPRRRNVEWHRSEDAQSDLGNESAVAEGGESSAQVHHQNASCVVDVKCVTFRPEVGTGIPRPGFYNDAASDIMPSRKLGYSSKVGAKWSQMKEVLMDPKNAKVNKVVQHVARHAKEIQAKGVTADHERSPLLKRARESSKGFDVAAKRLKIKKGNTDMKDKIPESFDVPSPHKYKLKKSKLESPLNSAKAAKKGKCPPLECGEKTSALQKSKGAEASGFANAGQHTGCDVCSGTSMTDCFNRLLSCGRCAVKVHQACYGVSKIPKGPWFCRTCKFSVVNPVCVLCGLGGGAMTRVKKSRGFVNGLLQAWHEIESARERRALDVHTKEMEGHSLANGRPESLEDASVVVTGKVFGNRASCESCGCSKTAKDGSFCRTCGSSKPDDCKISSSHPDVHSFTTESNTDQWPDDTWRSDNTVRAAAADPAAKQWAHMVCTLWMPGTRCLNMGTMGVFDVSGVSVARRKLLCSICKRKGGSCIQCRVPKCSVRFHPWCAHEKGLLQSETVQDGSDQVGFFGRCLQHGSGGKDMVDGTAAEVKDSQPVTARETCARTEAYKGRQSLEERAKLQYQLNLAGNTTVTPEQVAAWLHIKDRKSSTRRFIKPANSVMKCDHRDHREYLRFKQKKGWTRLAVYKSGIHALGLYTKKFIAEGEVVVEYIGEIVGSRVADKREVEYHSGKRLQYQGACYLFRIDFDQIIDATRKGGIARFVNHSCSPNCVAKVICVDNLKKVIFFAKRDIFACEEITYDYKFNYDEADDKIPCFCGSSECRGTLN